MGDSIPTFGVFSNIMPPRCQTKSENQELIDNGRRPKENCSKTYGNRTQRDAGKGRAVFNKDSGRNTRIEKYSQGSCILFNRGAKKKEDMGRHPFFQRRWRTPTTLYARLRSWAKFAVWETSSLSVVIKDRLGGILPL